MTEPLSLPSELTIYSVGEWAPRLRAQLARPADEAGPAVLCVDATAVAEVDAAGVQLLQALANALARDRRTLQLMAPSAALARACAALGLSGLLAGAAT